MKGLKEEGIFRIPASLTEVTKYRSIIDEGKSYSFTNPEIRCDCHLVASLLKLFFRELPNGLVSPQISSKLLEYSKGEFIKNNNLVK